MIRFTGAQGALEVISFPLRLLAAIFCSSLLLSAAFAQGNSALHESARAAQVRALNNSVLQLHGQVQENASSAGSVRGQAAQVLAQRAAALQALIQEDPRTALTFAFSPDLLADLAAKFPDSANLLESQVTLSGTVEHWIADSADMKSSTESWFLNSSGSRLSLHFATPKFPNPKMTPVVTIEGVQVGSQVAVSKVTSTPLSGSFVIPTGAFRGGNLFFLLALVFALISVLAVRISSFLGWLRSPAAIRHSPLFRLAVCVVALAFVISSPLTASAQTCSTTGAQNILVILVTFPGVSLPANITPAFLQDVFFATNTTGVSLDGFLREASYGQTSATGAVYGPFTLTGTYSSCSTVIGGPTGTSVMGDAIAAAAAAGANMSSYSRVVLVLPDIWNCGTAGVAVSGSCALYGDNGTLYNATWSVIYTNNTVTNLTEFTDRTYGVEIISHEFGHNLGLAHSGIISASPDVIGPVSTVQSTILDSGDYWSTMGERVLGLYASSQKANTLGWMSPTSNYSYQVVQNSGTYSIVPLELGTGGVQALRVERGQGTNQWLWIEYRQALGNYDSTLGTQPFGGALVHFEEVVNPTHTSVLNFTPSDSIGDKPALLVGQSWTDPYTNLSLSVVSASTSGVTVNVSYGALPCTSSAPTVSASPLNPSIYPGQTASYAVSVTNNDSSGCAANAISLSSTEPSGWSTSFSSPSVTLGPGQSANVTMGKGAPTGTSAGTYAVNLTAANSAATSTDMANATVVTTPSMAVNVSISGSSFTPPTVVPISATVTSGGSPSSGISVTFTLTAPNGGQTSQNVTTGSTGTATWNYKISSKSPVGTYTVEAQASRSSGGSGGKRNASGATQTASDSSNTASFSVQ